MRKSKTILDFFGKSPTNSSPANGNDKRPSSGKTVVKIMESPRGGNDKTPKLKKGNKLHVDRSTAKTPSADSERKTDPAVVSRDLNVSKDEADVPNSSDSFEKKKLDFSPGENGQSLSKSVRKTISQQDQDDQDTIETKSSISDKNYSLNGKNKSQRSSSSKHKIDEDVSDTDSSKKPTQSKRRRIVIASDSDSSDEYKPGKESESEEDYLSEASDISSPESPLKKRKKLDESNQAKPAFDVYKYTKESPSSVSVLTTPKSSSKSLIPESPICPSSTSRESFNLSLNSSFSHTASPKPSSRKSDTFSEANEVKNDKFKYLHERLDWLKPENIKDKSGRRRSHPDYNSETLYVPESFKKTLTPGLKQWWDIKSEHFGTVLFFKVGKFYEFYHMDAAIGVKELDLSYMKGDFAHAGFPEVAFGKFSDILIQKGYKVARIEQTETPQMMEQRCKNLNRPSKYDRVVKREICQVTSKGTRTLSYEEWLNNIGTSNNFLLAVCEKSIEKDSSASEYGICFVDTTIGKFTLGQFEDDRHQSRLLSFIALYPPVEILFDKASVSQKTLKIFDCNLTGISKQGLTSNSFCDAVKILKYLAECEYFKTEDDIQLPETIVKMLDQDDRLYQTPSKEYELAFKSLGACIWYLKKSLIEDCLLTMKLFEEYKPIDEISASQTTLSLRRKKDCKYMILDSGTLHNLAIVPLQASYKSDETLYGTLNYCETSFGKRELRKWLCSPLYQLDLIYDRLTAIEDLKDIPIFDEVRKSLRKLPDLERLLNKIHVHGLVRNKDHPDSRAVFYELEIYNKRKIADFLSALDGFQEAANISALFEPHANEVKSTILRECISTTLGCFPDMSKALSYFSTAFDHKEAMKQGSIIPRPGVDDNYDSACQKIKEVTEALNEYKNLQSKTLNCQIKFVNSGKNRYLLELPEKTKFPEKYEFLGGRKGYKRFYTRDIKEMLSDLISAEEARDSALRDTTRRIFAKFDSDYIMWQRAVQCLSTFDVLLSLTNYCKISDGVMCRPQFRSASDNAEPYLEIRDGRHPTYGKFYTGKEYIPNSIYIGKKENNQDMNKGGIVILVTGPNMGGKSTLMRQTGTLIVMAQLGCYVPAESMILTPVDRIFTRVGANDQIFKGESTFFVESSETASILHHATPESFVLIDELGRGTATYDGTAIAYATAHYLANSIGCRTLFSTHYHSLVEDFCEHPNVGLGHMACLVEEDKDCPTLEKVTFLYKFIEGSCPKSYGFNVAQLAGISKEIVFKGFCKSQQIDYGCRISKCIRRLLTDKTAEDIVNELRKKLDRLSV